jgi:hypothetical protein
LKTPLLFLLLSSVLLVARADVAVSDVPTSFPENELLKATPRSVFVAFMGDFRIPSTSGNWGAWALVARVWGNWKRNFTWAALTSEPMTGQRLVAPFDAIV